jgi:hypothetical protein
MGAHREPPVGIRLWPQPYAVARLRAMPEPLPQTPAAGAPVALIVGHDEVSLLAPEEVVDGLGGLVEHVSGGWRAFTVEAVFPLATVGFLAVVSRTLAEVSVPVMVFSSHDTDHFMVPSEHLGRALAALNQARLERFIPGK